MARASKDVLVTQSLLDRLSDTETWPETRQTSLAMYHQSLKRDIEWLLNTRKPLLDHIEDYPLVSTSVLLFGLSDSRIFGGAGAKDSTGLAKILEECIEQFEPRIRNPHVTLTLSDKLSRSLRFQVAGMVRYEDMEEEIQLDTVLELISGEYEVG